MTKSADNIWQDKNVVETRLMESERLEIPLCRLISIKLSCKYFNIIKRMVAGKNNRDPHQVQMQLVGFIKCLDLLGFKLFRKTGYF